MSNLFMRSLLIRFTGSKWHIEELNVSWHALDDKTAINSQSVTLWSAIRIILSSPKCGFMSRFKENCCTRSVSMTTEQTALVISFTTIGGKIECKYRREKEISLSCLITLWDNIFFVIIYILQGCVNLSLYFIFKQKYNWSMSNFLFSLFGSNSMSYNDLLSWLARFAQSSVYKHFFEISISH